MSEWWTYRLSDLLMFAPETYFRLFELYNRDIWPLQVVMAIVSLAIPLLAWRGRPDWHGRAIGGVTAVLWIWVAWAWMFERYATINWAAKWFAAAFILQSVAIAWKGLVSDRLRADRPRHPSQWIGLGLFAFALVLEPLVGAILGRSLHSLGLFGVTPDPTAVGTLGLILFLGRRMQISLLLIPLLWCAISAATLWTMRSGETWVVSSAGVVALIIAVWRIISEHRDDR